MSNLPDKIALLEQVGELVLKGYNNSQISRTIGSITPAQAKYYREQYQIYLQQRVNEDPDFLDRVAENTIAALEQLDFITSEAWETYELAKDNEMINQQIKLFGVFKDLQESRNKLLQLMGARADAGQSAQLKRAEHVNALVASIIRDVISKCDHCKPRAQLKLAEAFEEMNRAAEAADIRDDGEAHIEDAEIVEEEEFDTEAMMADIVGGD